jgi:hypothetical protein
LTIDSLQLLDLPLIALVAIACAPQQEWVLAIAIASSIAAGIAISIALGTSRSVLESSGGYNSFTDFNLTDDSDITASSQFGVNGTITYQ